MNRKIIPQLNIRWKKSSTLIMLTFVTLHLNYHERGWQMLTEFKLKVSFKKFLVFFLYPWGIPGGKPRLILTRLSIRARTIIRGKVAKATQNPGRAQQIFSWEFLLRSIISWRVLLKPLIIIQNTGTVFLEIQSVLSSLW